LQWVEVTGKLQVIALLLPWDYATAPLMGYTEGT